MSVAAAQRFTRTRPCPICGGYDGAPRHRGERCPGFLSDDGAWAHCTRQELANAIEASSADPPTYPHRLVGSCKCGQEHGATNPRELSLPAARRSVTDGAPIGALIRHTIRDFDGRAVAVHCRQPIRFEHGALDKRVWWERPDGRSGLGGLHPANMLYGAERLATYDPTQPLFLCEGEPAMDAAIRLGLQAVGTVTGAGTIKAPRSIGSTIARAVGHFDRVILWPDNDDQGRAHMAANGRALVTAGAARIELVRWDAAPPHGDTAQFAAAGGSGADALALVEPLAVNPAAIDAPPAAAEVTNRSALDGPEHRDQQPDAHLDQGAGADEPEGVVPSPRHPMLVAGKIVDEHHRESGVLTLRWWRGGFCDWSCGRWAEIEDKKIRAELYRLLRDARYWADRPFPTLKPWAPNRYKITDVCDALTAVGHTIQDVAPPTWLDREDGDPPAAEIIAVSNGLLHVPTRQLLPHTPRYFNTVAVPFAYDPHAPAPVRWLTFLGELWPDDPDARAAIQEWFGYTISRDTRLHKILLIVGPYRSGKGTIGRVLQALVGKANTCGPTLASLSTNFGLQDLIGKTLALIADARLGKDTANVVVERLLSISGEDSLTIDRKFKAHWFGRLDTRFVIMSNELPAFGDASGAIATRFVLLTIARSWLGHEDHELTNALLAELPGILNWALQGLDRLRAQDRFTEPASAKDAIAALMDTVSPTSAFVRDLCAVGPEHEVAVDTLYQAWRQWCEEQGRDHPGNSATFGKNLRAAVPGLKRGRLRDGTEREYQYIGISPRSRNDPQPSGPRTNQDRVGIRGAAGALVLAGPRTGPMLSSPSDASVVEEVF